MKLGKCILLCSFRVPLNALGNKMRLCWSWACRVQCRFTLHICVKRARFLSKQYEKYQCNVRKIKQIQCPVVTACWQSIMNSKNKPLRWISLYILRAFDMSPVHRSAATDVWGQVKYEWSKQGNVLGANYARIACIGHQINVSEVQNHRRKT